MSGKSDCPLRVLHVIHSLSGGGAETQLRRLVNTWPFPAVELGVFFVAGDPAEISNPAVRLLQSALRSTRHPLFFFEVARAIRTFDPHIVHIWLPEAVAIPAMLMAQLGRRRVIHSYRGRRRLTRFLTWVEVALATVCVDRIVSNHEVLDSTHYHRSVFRWLFRRKHGLIIRNGIEPGRPPGPAADRLPVGANVPLRLVCVGRLTGVKNYPRLIQALAQLKDRPDWSLDIWGEGEDRVSLQACIDQAELGARVRLRGHDGRISDRIAAASALILPSLSEGMPNVLVEAMGLGIPVIAADIEGVREVVADAPACIWIQPLDVDDIVRGVLVLMNNRVDLPAMVDHGYAIARRFSVQATQAAWYECYREVADAS